MPVASNIVLQAQSLAKAELELCCLGSSGSCMELLEDGGAAAGSTRMASRRLRLRLDNTSWGQLVERGGCGLGVAGTAGEGAGRTGASSVSSLLW